MRIVYFDIDSLRPDQLGCDGDRCQQPDLRREPPETVARMEILRTTWGRQQTERHPGSDPVALILQERQSKSST